MKKIKQHSSRVAAIDIGSNTALLSILDFSPCGKFKILSNIHETPRLLRGIASNGIISERTVGKLLRCLIKFRKECDRHNVDKIFMTGTEALRRARNSDNIVKLIRDKTGLKLKILPGKTEAFFSYISATAELSKYRPLVIDIGAGSTEFAFAASKEKFIFRSVKIGAFSLKKKFRIRYPLSPTKLKRVQSFIKRELQGTLKFRFSDFLGVGGTITTIPPVLLKSEYCITKTDRFRVSKAQVKSLIETIGKNDLAGIREMKGMPQDRADILLPGLLILEQAMALAGKPLIVRNRGLRYGILFDHLKKINPAIRIKLISD